jgi:uncharacterized membrane protein YdjX (TVP38/TMEM64 family)
MDTRADPRQATSSEPAARRGDGLLRIVVAAALLVALLLFSDELAGYIPRFAAWVDGLGFWGPLVYAAGYAVATVAMVPGSLLTLAAGALFGLGTGFATVFVGAAVGATLAFLVSRYAARSWVERRLEGHRRFAAVDRAIGAEGLKIAVLLRLSPVFPFNALNYALGLTRIRLRDYVVAHLGMIPGALLYVYYGAVAGAIATVASGTQAPRDAAYYTLLAVGLVATIVVTTIVTRIATRALRGFTDEQ